MVVGYLVQSTDFHQFSSKVVYSLQLMKASVLAENSQYIQFHRDLSAPTMSMDMSQVDSLSFILIIFLFLIKYNSNNFFTDLYLAYISVTAPMKLHVSNIVSNFLDNPLTYDFLSPQAPPLSPQAPLISVGAPYLRRRPLSPRVLPYLRPLNY